MLPIVLDTSTLRALERRTSRLFAFGACGFLCGTGLSLFDWPEIGSPLLLISAITLLAEMGWISRVLRDSCCEVRCPNCATLNEVFCSKRHYRCEGCGKDVDLTVE
jgi:hypothetical protein